MKSAASRDDAKMLKDIAVRLGSRVGYREVYCTVHGSRIGGNLVELSNHFVGAMTLRALLPGHEMLTGLGPDRTRQD
jgi:hypothetical protein